MERPLVLQGDVGVSLLSATYDWIAQRANFCDGDAHLVATLEGERIGGHNARARQEQYPVREEIVTSEVADEITEAAYDFAGVNGALKHFTARTLYRNRNGEIVGVGDVLGERNGWPHCATAPVHLGLGQVERIFPFDVAGTHVVADGIADNFHGWIDDQRQFGLGDVPGGVVADGDGIVRSDRPAGRRFEKDLWPCSRVDPVIDAAVGRFFFAGDAAPLIGDSGGPDFLVIAGAEERDTAQLSDGVAPCESSP